MDNDGRKGCIVILAVAALVWLAVSLSKCGDSSGNVDSEFVDIDSVKEDVGPSVYAPVDTGARPSEPQREPEPKTGGTPHQKVSGPEYDAYMQGYEEGYDQGFSDRYNGDGHYANFDDSGYPSQRYRASYQSGYEEGYEDGYLDGRYDGPDPEDDEENGPE